MTVCSVPTLLDPATREEEKKDVYTILPPFSCDKSSHPEVPSGHCLRHGLKVISGNRKERRNNRCRKDSERENPFKGVKREKDVEYHSNQKKGTSEINE